MDKRAAQVAQDEVGGAYFCCVWKIVYSDIISYRSVFAKRLQNL